MRTKGYLYFTRSGTQMQKYIYRGGAHVLEIAVLTFFTVLGISIWTKVVFMMTDSEPGRRKEVTHARSLQDS